MVRFAFCATIGCMQDKRQELQKLIDRYLRGQLDAEETRRMELWMHELDISTEPSTAFSGKKELLKQRIDERLRPTETPRDNKHWPRQALAIAASLLLLLFAGTELMLRTSEAPEEAQLATVKNVEAPLPTTQIMCNTSEQDSIINLSDGTKVRLLANSTLKLKVPFESSRRAVELEGKAFFHVAHDSQRPFSVLSGDILTTALGTSFWVEQAKTGAKPRVRLITGKVSVSQRQANGQDMLLTYLKPGQQWEERAVLKTAKIPQKIITETVSEEEPVAMMLFFHHKPLTEVLPALASFYKTTITFSAKDLEGMSFYGSYDHQNSVEQILTTICIANDLEMEWDKQQNKYNIRKVN